MSMLERELAHTLNRVQGLDKLFGTKTLKRAEEQPQTGGEGEQPVVIVLDDDFNSFIGVVCRPPTTSVPS